jgi:hypothetical protein
MAADITRPLEYANRVAVQQADQAIRKDVVRALVELITNCNDSYQRMEDAGVETTGRIIIEVERRHTNSVLRVTDNAEGMTEGDMDTKVGRYGEATSGFKEGRSVRGLWGRGLKDSFFGLGHGSVSSICDGKFSRCSLSVERDIPTFKLQRGIRATRAIKNQYELPLGNGTVMEIVISREGVKTPQFDNLRRSLEKHFELRGIMANLKRSVVLRDLDAKGKLKSEVTLSHKSPVGVEVLNEVIDVAGSSVQAHLQVFRANELLSTPAEEGDYADGGLLVTSKGVVLSLTLFKFEHNEHAFRFYGSVTCDHLHQLLKTDDGVLTATRDGINWKHSFAKCLKESVEKRLEPLVEEERKRAQAEQRSTLNKRLRERLNDALTKLNSIADSELGKLAGLGEGAGHEGKMLPRVPPSGFGFVPEIAYIQTGKPAGITLRASVPDKLEAGCLVIIESDNAEVTVLTPQVRIDAREDLTGIGEARVELEGRQVGAEAVITASVNGLKAQALVKVISKREPPSEPREKKEHGGLFRDVKFDPTDDPRQRVRFDRANANIVIATKAPSVAPYIDEHGNGSSTPQGQVLLAELVTEAVCSEIARRGVDAGKYLFIEGAQADAIRREHINLQNKYAHVIHECFVDSEHRRANSPTAPKKGRPSRAEQLAKALIAK